ncbi:hypothetical protein ON010_g10528 [Phytophthora cinnamomi]|nr:hypothetical protein ON010_g10528 [Phytophthora cinnamomi]
MGAPWRACGWDGIDKRAVLQGGQNSAARKKRENRTAAKTQDMKKARAARRAVAIDKAVQTTQGRCEGTAARARTSGAAGAIAVAVLQGVEPLQLSPHVTEVSEVISDTDRTGATTAVVDDVAPYTVRDAVAVAQLANVTIQKDNDTDHGSTRTNQMYYPIYGEYYTGSDVTVNANYVTTTETGQLAYINDRRQTPLGLEYRVFWVNPDRSCKWLYLCTWEPRARLAEDDFEVEMDLVDR